MSTPAITLDVLPAGYGDSLLITCPIPGGVWRLLVDTGPDEFWPVLKARLAQLPTDEHGRRFIDLLVVSHIDHDHIGAARLLLQDTSLGLTFGDIWFNAPIPKARRGVTEGRSLAETLGAPKKALPWNLAFLGAHAVTASAGSAQEVTGPTQHPRITLLSPDPSRLADLLAVWERTLAKLAANEPEVPPVPERVSRSGGAALDPHALAAAVTAVDRAPANGSSIAFLLEHQGASILLAADAFPDVLSAALRTLAAERRVPLPLEVDAIKLSHHGSRANTTTDLLKVVTADHYVVSTNGRIFGHPHDEALARVVVYGGHLPTLWFNHVTPRVERWTAPEATALHGYRIQIPANGSSGVTLTIKSRRQKRSE